MDVISFVQNFPLLDFRKGDVLLPEGQSNNHLFALRTGYVKVTSLHENGSEKLLWIAGRYDIVPTEQFFSINGRLRYFYTALSDGSMYDIDKPKFLEHAKINPTLMTEVATGMSTHYDDLMNRIDTVEQTTIRSKLIYTLCYVGERFSANNIVDLSELGLRLTQNDIAAMVGSTRETMSLELNYLKDHGAIEYSRSTLILNIEKLKALLI